MRLSRNPKTDGSPALDLCYLSLSIDDEHSTLITDGVITRNVRLTASAKATAVRRFAFARLRRIRRPPSFAEISGELRRDVAEALAEAGSFSGGGSFARRRKPGTTEGLQTTSSDRRLLAADDQPPTVHCRLPTAYYRLIRRSAL